MEKDIPKKKNTNVWKMIIFERSNKWIYIYIYELHDKPSKKLVTSNGNLLVLQSLRYKRAFFRPTCVQEVCWKKRIFFGVPFLNKRVFFGLHQQLYHWNTKHPGGYCLKMSFSIIYLFTLFLTLCLLF